MRKKITALLALSLAGCASLPTTIETENSKPQAILQVPQSIKHHGSLYQLKNQQDLGAMARYVYFYKAENDKNWQTAVELLHDRQQPVRSLAQRIELREKVYKNNGVEHFNLSEQEQTLYAFVIYAPNEQQKNWQVEVSRGAEVAGCGFVQYQYSLKVPQTRKLAAMGKVKLIGYLKKFAIDKEMARLQALNWDWHCVSNQGAARKN